MAVLAAPSDPVGRPLRVPAIRTGFPVGSSGRILAFLTVKAAGWW